MEKKELTDNILYFAYGSNMLSRRLCAVDRAPSATVAATGFVEGRRLTFDKVSSDGSGKCNIEETENCEDRVYGVVYRINNSEEAPLDRAEGLGYGYKKDMVDVITSANTYRAVVYVATKKKPALMPYHWYKAIVIAGAMEHGLPESYIEWIRTVDSKPDPNFERRSENEKLLLGK
jgi:cation transport regulator ChaC